MIQPWNSLRMLGSTYETDLFQSCIKALKFLMCHWLKALRSLVLTAVQQNGGAFAYAEPSLRGDRGRLALIGLLGLLDEFWYVLVGYSSSVAVVWLLLSLKMDFFLVGGSWLVGCLGVGFHGKLSIVVILDEQFTGLARWTTLYYPSFYRTVITNAWEPPKKILSRFHEL